MLFRVEVMSIEITEEIPLARSRVIVFADDTGIPLGPFK